MRINLLPAIVLAGPPHSGKSVLGYLLANQLKELGIQSYLLRAVPDGEGNWFLEGDRQLVLPLRMKHKTGYSSDFVEHMHGVIANRPLPLIVDIGGLPNHQQIQMLQACTHSILLYREIQELLEWRTKLEGVGLLPLAELQSNQAGEDGIIEHSPILRGFISGLERDPALRTIGPAFLALLDRVCGIFAYDPQQLEDIHLQGAPFPVMTESELAQRLGLPGGSGMWWEPVSLQKLDRIDVNPNGCAFYGRGPVWLTAAMAARWFPYPFAVFDLRYGWVPIASIPVNKRNDQIEYELITKAGVTWVEARLPNSFIDIHEFYLPPPTGGGGLVLSGKLPKWAFTRLMQHYLPDCSWIGVLDAARSRVIVVFSQAGLHFPGDVLLMNDDELI